MAEVMKFELVSPERKLASIDATLVQIPGGDGDFTAMAGHTPTVATLRPGILRAVASNGEVHEFVVSGGFAEISATGASVLAERAVAKSEATSDFLDVALKEAENALSSLSGDGPSKAQAELLVNDILQLKSNLS